MTNNVHKLRPPAGAPLGDAAVNEAPPAVASSEPAVPAPSPPTVAQVGVPPAALYIAKAHSLAQQVPWFAWFFVGIGAYHFYAKRGGS